MSATAKPDVLVEVAVDSVRGAELAERAGAHRIELCSALPLGGLTPSAGLLREVRRNCSLPIAAMARPRAGDFVYDAREFAVLEAEVDALAEHGADLLVFGLLTPDGDVDGERTASLCARAAPRAVTFHRAFDLARDPDTALAVVIAAGARRVLTSGQQRTARLGAATIARCVQQAGGRLSIVAGGGVRADHVRELVAQTGVQEVHLAATVWRPGAMRHRGSPAAIAMPQPPDEHLLPTTDGDEVARVVAALCRGNG